MDGQSRTGSAGGAGVVDWRAKSFPPAGAALALAEIGQQAWNLFAGDLWFPVLVLKESALAHNISRMARLCAAHGVSLAPHGKTTMAPAIIRRQLDAGAWAITAATPWQARAMREFGVRRVLLANQVVEPAAIRWMGETLAADPEFELLCCADSLEGVALMTEGLAGVRLDRPLPILLEIGVPGGRTGCRTLEAALAVASAIRRRPEMALAGVTGFEGLIRGGSLDATLASVDVFLQRIRGSMTAIDAIGGFAGRREIVVSAGGSAYFDRVVAVLADGWKLTLPVRMVLRSGCYVTHDHGTYAATSPLGDRSADPDDRLHPALELWGAVLSRPESELALLNFGRRDAPFDAGLPIPQTARSRTGSARDVAGRLVVTGLNDQHAYVRLPAEDPLAVGDVVGCGISHPCTAFDKWRLIPVVDDDYTVIGAVETRF
jgi:D-serine deaminase-like pyridoxal phosphate-dependent protein